LADLPWNASLREGLLDAFLKAVEEFKQRASLEYTWIQFVPDRVDDSFFSPLESLIKQKLRTSPIFRSTDNIYRLPTEVFTLPSKFRDTEDNPLIPERYLPAGMYYLSHMYGAHLRHNNIFAELGVQELSSEVFVQSLQRMESEFHLQSYGWHEAVCSCLLPHMSPGPRRSSKPAIQRLRILPLSNGSFVSSREAQDIFFDLRVAEIPDDLGLVALVAGLTPSTARYRLFQELGVKPADAEVIAGRILMMHGSGGYKGRNVTAFIAHAKFMFAHRMYPDFPLPTNLLVMDEQGVASKGSELYMDLPGQKIRMRDILPHPARFLHPEYLLEYQEESRREYFQWPIWLQNNLYVNICPRLIGGSLSPEFEAMVQQIGTRELLVVLQTHWPRIQANISSKGIDQLSRTIVTCENGTSHSLNATYIKSKSLIRSDLPFLPIGDPDDPKWDFLRSFGVSTEVNGSFFLKRLVQLQREGCSDEALIKDTYVQIQTRFGDDPEGIR
jgi:hypothetical protein